MKGGFYGLTRSQICLFLIFFTCATFFLWAWERTPILTALLPAQSQLLQLYPDIVMDTSVVSSASVVTHKYVGEDKSPFVEELSAVAGPSGSAESSPKLEEHDNDVKTTSAETEEEAKENLMLDEVSTTGTEVGENNKQILGENSKQQNSLYVGAVMGSAHSSYMGSHEDKNSIGLSENQACNYAKGKWVVDDNWPLYSGLGCKQWLAGMWACRLTQRTDFTYEKLRWQPRDCQMEKFQGSKFLSRMQDKSLAFVGDSLGRQQFQSLMCMITGGTEKDDILDVGKEYRLYTPRGAVRPDGWAYHFPSTNTTILYYWSASLCDLEPLDITNPTTDYALHLDRPPAFLRQFLHKFDVLVLNTGHHWNRGKFLGNRWVMHIGGKPNTDRRLVTIGSAKNYAVHSIVNWVNSQLPKHPGLKAFYRSISPRHFVDGDWNTGGSCDNTTPMSIGKEILEDESSDYIAGNAVNGTGVKLLDITALSQLRDEGHISRYSNKGTSGVQDCLHWCLPGIPDTWNELLFAQLQL